MKGAVAEARRRLGIAERRFAAGTTAWEMACPHRFDLADTSAKWSALSHRRALSPGATFVTHEAV